MQPGEGQRLGKITAARMWIEFAGRDLHDDGAGKAACRQQFQDLGADIIRDNMTLFDMYLVSVFQSPETKYELGIDTPLPYNIAVLR